MMIIMKMEQFEIKLTDINIHTYIHTYIHTVTLQQ